MLLGNPVLKVGKAKLDPAIYVAEAAEFLVSLPPMEEAGLHPEHLCGLSKRDEAIRLGLSDRCGLF
jgi:hypothetical protein